MGARKYPLFSQDGGYGPSSYVSIASVNATTGLLTNFTQVKVPIDVTSSGELTNVTCYPYNGAAKPPSGSPSGNTGSFGIPCGYPYSIFTDDVFTSCLEGNAISSDAKTAYAVLSTNDTLTKIDLTAQRHRCRVRRFVSARSPRTGR